MNAVLLPGNDLDAGFYDGLTRALERRGVRVRVLLPPGWPGVPPLEKPGWRALCDALERPLAEALSGGGTLIGHSLGAVFAILLAAAPPVRRLVLLEPLAPPARALAALLARAYIRDVVHGDRSRFLNGGNVFRRVHDLRRYPPGAIRRYLDCRRAADPATAAALLSELPSLYPLPLDRVRVPALVVRGARAGLIPRITQLGLLARLPRGRGLTLGRTGHWVANESDEAAAAAIAKFSRPASAPR